MAGYSVPRNDPYYYGEDSTYRPTKRKVKSVRETVRPEYDLDANGLPVRVNPVANSQKSSGRKFADLRGSVTPGSNEAAADNKGEGIQMDIAERHRAGAGYPGGVPRPADYPVSSTGRQAPSPSGGGASGTQTSPSAAKPGDLNAFADLLGSKYGVQFRGGFESNKLPGSGIGPVANGDEYGKHLNATKGTKGVGPFADGDTYARAVNGGHGEIAEGAQKGTSAVPDVGDQKRAVRVGRMDPRQRGGAQTGFNGADFSGAEPDNASLTSGISRRSRAFLDAPMGQGAMALRHAEASQGYIRQNGKNYAITGTGEDGKRTFQEFSDEGKNALQSDGNKEASQSFLKEYMMGETNAKAAENPAVEAPVQVNAQIQPNSNMGPLADTEQYGKMVDATKGMTGMGPLADGSVYGSYLDGREPMMRDPRKK